MNGLGWTAQVGMVVGALLATACCWLPLSLAIAGLTVVGLGATLDAWRPLFLVLTFGLMAWSFREAFLRRPVPVPCAVDGDACGSEDAGCAARRRNARLFFVAHAALVGVVLLIPMAPGNLSLAVAGEPGAEAAALDAESEWPAASLRIEGMTCMGCVRGVTEMLERQVGVRAVAVTLDPPRARVSYEAELTNPAALIAALADGGYGAAPEEGAAPEAVAEPEASEAP